MDILLRKIIYKRDIQPRINRHSTKYKTATFASKN